MKQKLIVLTEFSNGFMIHTTSKRGPEEILIQDDGSSAYRSLKDAFDRADETTTKGSECRSEGPQQPNGHQHQGSEGDLLDDPHVRRLIHKGLGFLSGASDLIGKGRDRGG